jgi:hypothetical protein
MHTARGASALVGVARIVETLFTMSPKDGERYRVQEEDRRLYVRLDVILRSIQHCHVPGGTRFRVSGRRPRLRLPAGRVREAVFQCSRVLEHSNPLISLSVPDCRVPPGTRHAKSLFLLRVPVFHVFLP